MGILIENVIMFPKQLSRCKIIVLEFYMIFMSLSHKDVPSKHSRGMQYDSCQHKLQMDG